MMRHPLIPLCITFFLMIACESWSACETLANANISLPLVVVEDLQCEDDTVGLDMGDSWPNALRIALYQYRHIINVPTRSSLLTFIREKRIETDLGITQKAIFEDQVYKRIGVHSVIRGSCRKRGDAWIIDLRLLTWENMKGNLLPPIPLGEIEVGIPNVYMTARSVAQRTMEEFNKLTSGPYLPQRTVSIIIGCFLSLSDKYKAGQRQFSADLLLDLEKTFAGPLGSFSNLTLYRGSKLKQKCNISGSQDKQA